MSSSRSVTLPYACPACHTVDPVECWLIVDTDDRPDLAARVGDGTLHYVRCAHCGTLSEVQVPLLVYRPPGQQPVLVYSPVSGASEDVERRDWNELRRELQQGLGDAWREAWVAEGVFILPRPSLALLLRATAAGTGSPEVGIVAADRVADDAWRRYLASRAPETLDTAIDLWRQALALAGESPAGRARCLLAYGRCLAERFGVRGNLADLDAATEALQAARETGALDPAQRPALLLTLGNVLAARHERDRRHRHDLDAAIDCYAEALMAGLGEPALPRAGLGKPALPRAGLGEPALPRAGLGKPALSLDVADALTAASNYAGALRDRYALDGRIQDRSCSTAPDRTSTPRVPHEMPRNSSPPET